MVEESIFAQIVELCWDLPLLWIVAGMAVLAGIFTFCVRKKPILDDDVTRRKKKIDESSLNKNVPIQTEEVLMGRGENGQAVRGEEDGEVGRENGRREREEDIQTVKEEDGRTRREDGEESVHKEEERIEETEREDDTETKREELREREGGVPEESEMREEKTERKEEGEAERKQSERDLVGHEPATTSTQVESQTKDGPSNEHNKASGERGSQSTILLNGGEAATSASNEIQAEEHHEEESAPVITTNSHIEEEELEEAVEETGVPGGHTHQEVGRVNGNVNEEEVGEEEKKRWSFPPELEDFDLMESDVDPADLEQIFADNRLIEIYFDMEPDQPGLGISIVGGSGSPSGDLPIIIKRVLPGSLASRDGRLKQGDELVAANETLLVGVTKDVAIGTLTNMRGKCRLLALQED